MTLPAGSRIGPYEIVGWIGAGGMGSVYRARDPRLAREVAVKLVHEKFGGNPDQRRRFEQEARATGQLNHPNILTVFDTGTHEGTPFIVSELLEGESLRQVLERGPLPADRTADFARQIAFGLAAAHSRDIVHRDIKPDNLFVTNDGRIKILDFGIAKLKSLDESPPTPGSRTETAPEGQFGTAPYMSPEHVRGEPVDARSDIFSLGAVVYEMLAGQPAFARKSPAETAAAVLTHDPMRSLSTRITPAFERIVSRCLEKQREARFQSARDLSFSLDAVIHRGGASGSRWILVAAALGLLVIVSTGLVWLLRDRTPPFDFSNPRFSRFTDWKGTEGLAEISPDGRFVAFVSDRDGEFDLYIRQIDSQEPPANLTLQVAGLDPPGNVLRSFGFSGDGSELWYSDRGQPGREKKLLNIVSRTSRPFLAAGNAAPAWSPDGAQVAYLNNKDGGGDPLFVANANGERPRQIHVGRPFEHNHNPVWSTDGRLIYFAHGTDPSSPMNVWRVPASGGVAEQLTDQNLVINFLATVDVRTLLFVALDADASGPWLWTLDVPTKTIRRVAVGVNAYTSVSASRDGRRIVATVADPAIGLWTIPLLDRVADERDAAALSMPATRALAPRMTRDSTYFLSAEGGGDGLYRRRGTGITKVWQDKDRPLAEPVAVSRDGRQLAVVVRIDGKRRLLVMSEDGTDVRTLAPEIEIQGAAGAGNVDWSADGEWIVAGGSDAKGPALFKIPLDGRPAIRLVEGRAVDPIWSSDGTLIVYAAPFVDGQVPLRGVTPDRQPRAIPEIRVRPGGYRFLPGQHALVYLERTGSLDFSYVDLTNNTRRQLTHLVDRGKLHSFDISPDGRQLVFDRLRQNSNVALIELPAR